jgi:pyrroline-5-carboxylate reductase
MNTGFVGIGSMGGMLVRGLLRSRALAVENVWAANRSEGKQLLEIRHIRGGRRRPRRALLFYDAGKMSYT